MSSFDCIARTIDADTASQVIMDCIEKVVDDKTLLRKWLSVVLTVLEQAIVQDLVQVVYSYLEA